MGRRPVFAYGFEDLTGAEWGLLEALPAAPRSPSRSRTSRRARPSRRSRGPQEDLAALAGGRDRGASRRARRVRPPCARAPRAAPLRRTRRRPRRRSTARPLLRGRRARAARSSSSPRRSRELAASGRAAGGDRPRRPVASSAGAPPLETVLGTLGIPFAVDGSAPARPDRRSARRCWRCSASRGSTAAARDLYAFLRSPVLRLRPRERRLPRGPAARPRGHRPRRCRGGDGPGCATGSRCRRSRRSGPPRPGRGRAGAGRRDAARRARARRAAGGRGRAGRPARVRRGRRLLDELDGWRALGGELAADEVVAALERARRPARLARSSAAASRSSTSTRARTRRFDVVFLLGLEEGSLPRRASPSPFLDDDARGGSTRAGRGSARPDPVERERYLFYTACTRATQPPDARARGRDRRGQPARGEPVLGRGRRALRPGGRRARGRGAGRSPR